MTYKKTMPSTGPKSTDKNGITGDGQTQYGAQDSNFEISKGGMRGVGLIAVMLGEMALKAKAADLAEDYYKLNKKDYDFFISTHQEPIAQTAAEAFDEAVNPTYIFDPYFAGVIAAGASAQVDKQWFQIRRRAHRYATGAQRRIDYEFAVLRAHAVVGAWNLGRRYERNWVDDRNNRQYDRRLAIANIGIGVGAIVSQGLSNSVQRLASTYDYIGDNLASIGNGLSANMGYKAGRADTRDRYGSFTGSNTKTKNMAKPFNKGGDNGT